MTVNERGEPCEADPADGSMAFWQFSKELWTARRADCGEPMDHFQRKFVETVDTLALAQTTHVEPIETES